MLPVFNRSTQDKPAGFLAPDRYGRPQALDLELGTADGTTTVSSIRDATYEARANGDAFEYRKQGSPSWATLLSAPGLSTFVSFTFDQLMRPMGTYQTGPGLNRVARTGFLYWYDTIPGSYQTLSVPNVISPVLTFDYPMDGSASFAEASWWYLRNDNVCYRRQADRFTIEYVFAPKPADIRIISMVGLGRNYRLHVQLER